MEDGIQAPAGVPRARYETVQDKGFLRNLRHRVAFRFAIEGDLRFISHHDRMRLFERALSRAQLPVKFSEGFNPRPRLSLPLPRAVGVASVADLLVVDMQDAIEPQAALERLSAQMPAGLKLLEARTLAEGESLQVRHVEYALALPDHEAPRVAAAVQRLLQADDWIVQRQRPGEKKARTVDLRPYLVEAHLEGTTLHWKVLVTNSGSIRPVEWIEALGLAPEAHQHHVRRIAVEWQNAADQAATSDTPTEE